MALEELSFQGTEMTWAASVSHTDPNHSKDLACDWNGGLPVRKGADTENLYPKPLYLLLPPCYGLDLFFFPPPSLDLFIFFFFLGGTGV
jgi:hypothetical protein